MRPRDRPGGGRRCLLAAAALAALPAFSRASGEDPAVAGFAILVLFAALCLVGVAVAAVAERAERRARHSPELDAALQRALQRIREAQRRRRGL